MKFRLAAIDLDGTLLTSRKTLTPRTIASVQHAVHNGLTVVICTGRMVQSALRYWTQLQLDTPIAGYNGAHVKDVIRQDDLLLRPLPPDVTGDILAYCRERSLMPLTYQDDRLYVERECMEVQHYSSTYGVPYEVVPALADFLHKGSTKVLLSCPPEQCARTAAEMQERFGNRVSVTQSEGRHVELNHPSANKASAVAFLANRFGVGREEIVAFGDGINDIEMLQYVGHGVAVANGWEEAKQAADEVIGSNDEDAVAQFLDSLEI